MSCTTAHDSGDSSGGRDTSDTADSAIDLSGQSTSRRDRAPTDGEARSFVFPQTATCDEVPSTNFVRISVWTMGWDDVPVGTFSFSPPDGDGTAWVYDGAGQITTVPTGWLRIDTSADGVYTGAWSLTSETGEPTFAGDFSGVDCGGNPICG